LLDGFVLERVWVVIELELIEKFKEIVVFDPDTILGTREKLETGGKLGEIINWGVDL
jgi:hypothetical protein